MCVYVFVSNFPPAVLCKRGHGEIFIRQIGGARNQGVGKGRSAIPTVVNVYVDLVVFTRIAGTSYTGSGTYWC